MKTSFHISLPKNDPNSAHIQRWLNSLPPRTDVSREARRVMVAGITIDERLAHIEQLLTHLLANGVAIAPPAPMSSEQSSALDALFDFGV